MKKVAHPNKPIYPHINGQIVQQIAQKAKCDPSYVWMILNGRRAATSRKAKAISIALKKTSASVETGLKRATKELILIGEND